MGDLAASRIGVEEEFHLVDLQTRRVVPAADAVLARLGGDSFAPELQRSLVEANTVPCASLDELRADLCRLRRRLNDVAGPLGIGVLAAGTAPLVDLPGTDISASARYERMQHEYQLLVREQHICGARCTSTCRTGTRRWPSCSTRPGTCRPFSPCRPHWARRCGWTPGRTTCGCSAGPRTASGCA